MGGSSVKKLLIAAIAIAAFCGAPVFAADMPVRDPVYKAAPVFDWSGFYGGVNAGYAWQRTSDNLTGTDPIVSLAVTNGAVVSSVSPNPNGFIGGGQVGFNRQFSSNLVLGIEADISGAGINGTAAATGNNGLALITTGNQKIDLFGTVRGRLGYAWDRSLFYVTGGFAFGNVKLATSVFASAGGGCNGTNFCQSASTTATNTGFTFGAGWEQALLNNWSLKAEYLYYDLGHLSHTFLFTQTGGICVGGCTHGFTADADFRGNIIRMGLNYKFGSR